MAGNIIAFGLIKEIKLTIMTGPQNALVSEEKRMFYCGELDSGILDYIEYKYIYNPDRDNLINKYVVEDSENTLPEYVNYVFPTLAKEQQGSSDVLASWDKYFGSVNKGDQKYYIVHIPGRTTKMVLYNEDAEEVYERPFDPFNADDSYSSNRLILIIQTKDTIEILNLGYDIWIYRKNDSERNLWKYNLHKNDHGPGSIVQNPRGTEIQIDGTSDALLGIRKIANTPILEKKKAENSRNPWKSWLVYKKGEEVQWKGETWISLENNNRETPDASVKWAKKGNIENSLNYRIKVYAVPEEAATLSPSGYISLGKNDKVRIEVKDFVTGDDDMFDFSGVFSNGEELDPEDYVQGNTEDGKKYFIIPNPERGNIVFSYYKNDDYPKYYYYIDDAHSAVDHSSEIDISDDKEITETKGTFTVLGGEERVVEYVGCPIDKYKELDNFNPGFTFSEVEYRITTENKRITVKLVFMDMSDEKNFVIDDPTKEVRYGEGVSFQIKAVGAETFDFDWVAEPAEIQSNFEVTGGGTGEGLVECSNIQDHEDITIKLFKQGQ